MSTQASNRIASRDRNPNSIDKSLGSRLRTKRESTGLSHQQLAEKLRTDPQEIKSYETGEKRISAFRLLELAEVLSVSPAYFFGSAEEHQGVAVEVDKRPWARAGVYLTLPDQGVRLNRAFLGVVNPDVREAIITLVMDLARSQGSR